MMIRSSKKNRFLLQLLIAFAFILLLLAFVYLVYQWSILEEEYIEIDTEQTDPLTANYDTHDLDDTRENKQIKYGFELFTNTAEYLGPGNRKKEKTYSGNNLSCNNCHLKAGTKLGSNKSTIKSAASCT